MLRFLVSTALFAFAYGSVEQAVVNLQSGDVQGRITFTKTGDGIRIQGSISGLAPGKHGFHIHEKGDLAQGCAAAGGHLNPFKKSHGAPGDQDRHVGDLGNVVADQNKVAEIDFLDKVISFEGETCIIGRALVVHADEDDLGKGGFTDSKTTGHAGARVACGVVGIANYTADGTGKGGGSQNLGNLFLFLMAVFLTNVFSYIL